MVDTTATTDATQREDLDAYRQRVRSWLADNMPRMVEKALHIEIAESIKAPKKP